MPKGVHTPYFSDDLFFSMFGVVRQEIFYSNV